MSDIRYRFVEDGEAYCYSLAFHPARYREYLVEGSPKRYVFDAANVVIRRHHSSYHTTSFTVDEECYLRGAMVDFDALKQKYGYPLARDLVLALAFFEIVEFMQEADDR